MKFFDLIKKYLLINPNYTGVNPDDRFYSEKAHDYRHEERVFPEAINPFGNVQITESPYTYENQKNTSSCVSHGVGLALAIERKLDGGDYIRPSYMYNYRLRPNFPSAGCFPQAQFDLYRNKGAPLYATLPNVDLEVDANAIKITSAQNAEAANFKGLTYFTVVQGMNDIAVLANIAQKGHGIAILIYGSQDEWGREYPEILEPKMQLNIFTEIRHSVCILPYSGFIKDGKRYVTIQDSAWFGAKKIRHLSEDWISKRVYNAMYWDTVVPAPSLPPVYTFKNVLRFGSKGIEVQKMQEFLISEGLLPADCATGNYFGLTLAAVNAFQLKYRDEILTPLKLSMPTGIWGNQCILVANRIGGDK